MDNTKVRKVRREDSKRIWEIRNHPVMRANSNNQEETPFEKHDHWFENKYFSGDDNHCYALENEGKVMGYCRFDFDDSDDNYVISIAIDVKHQGKGWGKLFLKEVLEVFGSPGKEVVAQTFKKNIPSVKIFQRNNFKIYKEDGGSYYFRLKK